MFRFLLCCFAIFGCGVVSFPQSSSPCQRDDPKCLTSLFQVIYAATFEGSSESKIDPLFQKRIDATLPTLVFTLTDTTTKGFKSCQIKDTSISPDKTTVHLEMLCPRFEMFGHYEAEGTIEKVPFQGNGGFTLDARDYYVKLNLKFDTTVRDGKKYTKIIDFDVDAELKGALDFKLENLFNGNKELSAAAHKFIKEEPKFVTQYMQKQVFMANIKKIVVIFNKSLENVSVDGFVA